MEMLSVELQRSGVEDAGVSRGVTPRWSVESRLQLTVMAG